MSILYAFNNVFAQSSQENAINTASLNTIMNQGYEFKGIVGNCIVVEKDYMCGILKTNAQWLIKPQNNVRVGVLHNVIMCEKSYEKAGKEYEENALYDGSGKELIKITFTGDMSDEEQEALESKYQLELVNKLFENETKITKLKEIPQIRRLGVNEERALKDGYLIANGDVFDRNGNLIFEKGLDHEYCGNGVFYFEDRYNDKRYFINGDKAKSPSALNSFLEQGYMFRRSFGNCIILSKDDGCCIVDTDGKRILEQSEIQIMPYYNLMECKIESEKGIIRCLLDWNGNVKYKSEPNEYDYDFADYNEMEKVQNKFNNLMIKYLLNSDVNIQAPIAYEYDMDSAGGSHVMKALEDGYLIFVDYNKGHNAVLDRNGRIVIQSENKIIYCGNELFVVERLTDRYSFTLIK